VEVSYNNGKTVAGVKELIVAKLKSNYDGFESVKSGYLALKTLDGDVIIQNRMPEGDEFLADLTVPEAKELKYAYKEPKRLCQSYGSKWKYQWVAGDIFSEHLQTHFDSWKISATDKSTHPIILALSGPGTGKSRFLDELPHLLRIYSNGKEYHERIQRAYVFKVTFENGTSGVVEGKSAGWQIAVRMMHQLLVDPLSFDNLKEFLIKSDLSISDVIQLLSTLTEVSMKELCVILLVDGLQHLPHTPGSKTSMLYAALTSICNVVNSCPAFVIAAVSATISDPFGVFLASSAQRRIIVRLPRLVFKYEDVVKNLLATDMGGHGRALECLDQVLSTSDDNSFSFQEVVSKVVQNLKSVYDETLFSNQFAIIKACIGRIRFNNKTDKVPGSIYTVDQIVSMGLFSFDEDSGLLEVPNIFLELQQDKLWRTSYNSMDHTLNPDENPLSIQTWQHWEDINARFRCLKSILFSEFDVSSQSSAYVQLGDLHLGAKFASPEMKSRQILSRPLFVENLSVQLDTSSACCQGETDKFYLSAPANSAGDGFCCFRDPKKDSHFHEVHQYKHRKGKISEKIFLEEKSKSSSQKDFFILFSTSDSDDFQLPINSALVDSSNWEQYYGPYWARAFFMKTQQAPSINHGSIFQLSSIKGVKRKRAEKIIEERKHGEFHSLDDACKRLKLSETTLSLYREFNMMDVDSNSTQTNNPTAEEICCRCSVGNCKTCSCGKNNSRCLDSCRSTGCENTG